MLVYTRLGLFGACLLLALGSHPSSAQTRLPEGTHPRIVVTFANEPLPPLRPAGSTGRSYAGGTYGLAQRAQEQARQISTRYALRQVASWPIKPLAVHCVVYEIPDARSVTTLLQTLSHDPRVGIVQSLQEFHTLTAAAKPADTAAAQPADAYNDPLYGLQSNLVELGIAAAHTRAQGAGVRIGLIDTGVDAGHPDLHERISLQRSFVSQNQAPSWFRHGTAMAGLIAAVANNNVGIVGIAPRAEIAVFQACWQLKPDADDAACNTFTLAQALTAAIEARLPLVNLSLAGPADPLLTALVNAGLKQGTIFVGATAAQADSFPTNIPGVIGVAASEHQQAGASLLAPAAHVLTLRPASQYDFESGSSVAAAEVTALIALLLGESPHLNATAVLGFLSGGQLPASATGGQTGASVEQTPAAGGQTGASVERPATVNINGALARLEASRSAGRVAATNAR